MKNKINFPALALCGFLSLGFFNCTSAPEIRKEERKTLVSKLDVERNHNTYTLELRKGNLFVGINPVRDADGKAGYIIEIYDERKENEYIDMMLEIYEDKLEIFDETLKKNRLASTNCHAGEIRIQTPDFYMKFNKKYELKGKEKVFSEWWHVSGKIYDKDSTVIDIDGDGSPEIISYGDKNIELCGNKNLEKEKDVIAKGWKLLEKAKNYFYENVGRNFENIRF